MMITARVTELGGSAVVVLSAEMLSELGIRAGDEVKVGAAGPPDLNSGDGAAEQVLAARRIMEKRYDVLRRLAE